MEGRREEIGGRYWTLKEKWKVNEKGDMQVREEGGRERER